MCKSFFYFYYSSLSKIILYSFLYLKLLRASFYCFIFMTRLKKLNIPQPAVKSETTA